MIKFFSNLFGRSSQLKTETVDQANTALRVGSLLEDLTKASAFKWDPAGYYEAGQTVYFNNLRYEAVIDTSAGESPQTHPLKWSVKAVESADQITPTNRLPVLASAVWQYLNQYNAQINNIPNATPTTRGIVRQATDEENNEGLVDDAFISPKQARDQLKPLVEAFIEPTLQSVMAKGNVTNESPILQGTVQKGDPNLNFDHSGTGVSGLIFKWLGVFKSFLGFDASGTIFGQIGSNVIFQFAKVQTTFSMDVLAAINTHIVAQQFSTSLLSTTRTPTAHAVFVYDAVHGRYTIKGLSESDNAANVLAYMNMVDLANKLRPLLTGEQVEGDERVIIATYCEDVPDDPVFKQFIPLTNAMLGTAQPHKLNVAGNRIQWGFYMTYPANATGYDETATDPEHFLNSNESNSVFITFPDHDHFIVRWLSQEAYNNADNFPMYLSLETVIFN